MEEIKHICDICKRELNPEDVNIKKKDGKMFVVCKKCKEEGW